MFLVYRKYKDSAQSKLSRFDDLIEAYLQYHKDLENDEYDYVELSEDKDEKINIIKSEVTN